MERSDGRETDAKALIYININQESAQDVMLYSKIFIFNLHENNRSIYTEEVSEYILFCSLSSGFYCLCNRLHGKE